MLSVALPQPQCSSLHCGFSSKTLPFSAFVEKISLSWICLLFLINQFFFCVTPLFLSFQTLLLCIWFFRQCVSPLSLSMHVRLSFHICVSLMEHPLTGSLIPASLSPSRNHSLSSPTPFPLPPAPPTALTKGRETSDTKLRSGGLIIFSKTSPSHFLAQQHPRVSRAVNPC